MLDELEQQREDDLARDIFGDDDDVGSVQRAVVSTMLSFTIAMRRRWQGREFGDRGMRKVLGGGEVWERLLVQVVPSGLPMLIIFVMLATRGRAH
jgi:hypothetical protein